MGVREYPVVEAIRQFANLTPYADSYRASGLGEHEVPLDSEAWTNMVIRIRDHAGEPNDLPFLGGRCDLDPVVFLYAADDPLDGILG